MSLKRYRFAGKERDEETGLNYHGVRYYAPWLGRWTSADPAGLVDGPNLYQYALSNPIVRVDAKGTDSTRTYQLGLGFDGGGLTLDPRIDSELNTNITELMLGGLGKLAPSGSKWYVYGSVWGAQFLTTVFSHEFGHWREAIKQNQDPELHLFPLPHVTSLTTNFALFAAGGVNQNTLNTRQLWRGDRLSLGDRTLTDEFRYWANESYLLQYTLRALAQEAFPSLAPLLGGDKNDIKNYVDNTSAGYGGVFAGAFTTTALNVASEVFADKIEGVFHNKLVAPRFEALLPTSGDMLFGVQTIIKPGGLVPPIELNLDSTLTLSAFSFTAKAHDFNLGVISSRLSRISISPFVSFTRGGQTGGFGISGGTDISLKLTPDVSVKGTIEGLDQDNPLNEIKGYDPGVHGAVNAQFKF